MVHAMLGRPFGSNGRNKIFELIREQICNVAGESYAAYFLLLANVALVQARQWCFWSMYLEYLPEEDTC
jgi:hypothetical protein